ncbi:MAG: transcriptional repressor LexA [Oligoflexia bacterium]|nr:transcriptional repressor LexA [Oligoflexia bacterium]
MTEAPKTKNKFLTPKQKQVLDFIHSYQREKDYSPSQQEIAQHFGFSSLGTVQHYLNQLEALGLLQKSLNARRGLSLSESKTETAAVEPPSSLRALPVLGKVAAGRPIEAASDLGSIEVPQQLMGRSGKHFVLLVQGDSMIGDGILEGDFVVIRQQSTAANGETVVALIENEATIKRYFKDKDQVELRAANPAYPPIRVDGGLARSFRIEGVLTGLIRKT